MEGNKHSKSQNVMIHVFLANKVPGCMRRDEVQVGMSKLNLQWYITPHSLMVRLESPQQVSCIFRVFVYKEI